MARLKDLVFYNRRVFGPELELVPDTGGAWHPAADVFVTEDKVIVVMEVAGVDPRDMDITYESGRIIVRGYRKHPAEGRSPRSFIRMEIPYGHFERIFEIPIRCNPETVAATYKDGLILIEAAIAKGELSRDIPIK